MSRHLASSLALATLWAADGVAPTGAESPPAPSPVLRYLTLNVLHGGASSGLTGRNQELERRLEIVSEELAALRPDIVGLQEASTSRRRENVARRLAERLGFHYVYAPALFPSMTMGLVSIRSVIVMARPPLPASLSADPRTAPSPTILADERRGEKPMLERCVSNQLAHDERDLQRGGEVPSEPGTDPASGGTLRLRTAESPGFATVLTR